MPPQRKSGGKILRDGFCVFTRIAGLAFHSDSWTLISGFSKGPGSLVFRTLDVLDWFYKGYDSVFRILDILDGSFIEIRSVFLDVGLWILVFLLDFGLTYNLFSFAYIKIEILSAFISFHRLLFNQLLGKLICI
jgi:hypothetical protein